MATSPTTPSQLDETLNQTEIGAFIAKNKTLTIGLFVTLIVGLIAYGVYNAQKDKSDQNLSTLVYNFSTAELKDLKDKKLEVGEFVKRFQELKDKVGSFRGMAPLIIQATDELLRQEKTNEALGLLTFADKELSNKPYISFLILSRLAVVYEDLGQNQKALESLEKLNALGVKPLEAKVYLDLGRLYLATGNKTKAKDSFQYIVDKFSSEKDFASLAKLYLAKLGAE